MSGAMHLQELLEQAEAQLHATVDPVEKIRLTCKRASLLARARHIDEGYATLLSVADLVGQMPFAEVQWEWFYAQANLLHADGHSEQALEVALQARAFSSRAGSRTVAWARCTSLVALLRQVSNDRIGAARAGTRALTVGLHVQDDRTLMQAALSLTGVACRLHDFVTARRLLDVAHRCADAMNDPISCAAVQAEVRFVDADDLSFASRGVVDTAARLALAQRLEETLSAGQAAGFSGPLVELELLLAEQHMALRRRQAALQRARAMLPLAVKLKRHAVSAGGALVLARALAETQDPESLSHVAEALGHAKKSADPDVLMRAYESASVVYQAFGMTTEVINHVEQALLWQERGTRLRQQMRPHLDDAIAALDRAGVATIPL